MQPSAQFSFSHALLTPDAEVPEGIVDPEGRIASKRFAVYRNNVTVSLVDALAATFTRVQAVVGEDFFREMARQYVRAHPPQSPLIMEYGGSFSEFIAAFEPAKGIPFLADIAKIDRAWLDAFHAEDATNLDANKIASLDEDHLTSLKFVAQPALKIVKSDFPIVTLWDACRTGVAPQLADSPAAEWALIVRPDVEVNVVRMSVAEGVFFADLATSVDLGSAAEHALSLDSAFDFATTLSRVVSVGAFTDIVL